MADTFDHGTPPGPWELLACLGGQTTYREPIGGRSTRHGAVPHPHRVAAVVGLVRDPSDPTDCGQEIAWDIALGTTVNQRRVCLLLAEWLGNQRWRSVDRSGHLLRQVAWEAYLRATGSPVQIRVPAGIVAKDWETLVKRGQSRLDELAQRVADAITREFCQDD